MAPLTVAMDRPDVADAPGRSGPPDARTADKTTRDRSAAVPRADRAVRSWPLLVLAAPAAAEVWSGWVGIAERTGFGLVSPLPGIWPSLHLDTAITLPIGVEAYAAYALRAWLGHDRAISARTRRFAKRSAIFSFALGMAGQVAYHLMAQAGMARAPWLITTIVSCLPVLVLAMGTGLAHMLRADAATDRSHARTTGPALVRPADRSLEDHDGPARDRVTRGSSDPPAKIKGFQVREPAMDRRTTQPKPQDSQSPQDQAWLVARRLAAAGERVSRRRLRDNGVRGSNELLNGMARKLNAQLVNEGMGFP
jgi:hypothetical protein